MNNRKRVYSKELKKKGISLSYHRVNLKELANELGINVERIYKWRTGSKPTENSHSNVGRYIDPQVSELKKQLRESQLELEILKKAVHISV